MFEMAKIVGVVLFVTFLSTGTRAVADDVPLVKTDEFAVTDSDLQHYIRFLAEGANKAGAEISVSRISQALIELYALETLSRDAESGGILVDDDYASWLTGYLLRMERVKRWTTAQVAAQMTDTDVKRLARDYYKANPAEFLTSEVLTVRSFVISTRERTVLEAVDLARDALPGGPLSPEDFEKIILEVTDDRVSRRQKGVMTLKRGETVPQFEEAAFALEQPNDMSDLVISKFGVHVIQLISRDPPEKVPFAEVREQIEARLLAEDEQALRKAIVLEAREREPAGFVIDAEAVDAFMRSRGYEPPKITIGE